MDQGLVLYWSRSGNTEKVAAAVLDGIRAAGLQAVSVRIDEAENVDLFAYDLVCLAFPSYNWHPPVPVDAFLKTLFQDYKREGRVKPCAPRVPGKNALVVCTYSGPHTGVREAIPPVKYVGQFFEHLGFVVADEWYVLSECHGSEELSTQGRMGDIRGLPTTQELARLRDQARLLVARL